MEMNLHYLDQVPGRTALIQGKEYLFFSGYNYLGINQDPQFNDLLKQGLRKYRWMFPSSRISNTRLHLFEECEALLSELTSSEETVLFSSGFSAGRAAVYCKDWNICNAPGSHPAISRTGSDKVDFGSWSAWFVREVNESVVPPFDGFASDSLNPLKASVHDFSFLKKIRKPVVAVIDDSHGMGVLGTDGRGTASTVPANPSLQYLFSYSLSKAFGIAGGAVSCSRELASCLRALPEYATVSPPSPAQLYAFIHGQHIYAQQRQTLLQNIRYFAEQIKDLPGVTFSKDFPVFILAEAGIAEQLYRKDVIISSFSYPDQEGVPVDRVVLNALHTRDDLDRLSEYLHQLNDI